MRSRHWLSFLMIGAVVLAIAFCIHRWLLPPGSESVTARTFAVISSVTLALVLTPVALAGAVRSWLGTVHHLERIMRPRGVPDGVDELRRGDRLEIAAFSGSILEGGELPAKPHALRELRRRLAKSRGA